MDARWWVIHTEEAMRSGLARVRGTTLDNHPEGRELHWSSGLVWLLSAIAHVRSVFTGKPPIEEVQNAPLYSGTLLLGLFAVLIAMLVGRRFGWGFAGFHILVLTTAFPVYEMFRAGEGDHHGIILMFAVGSVVSLVAGGAGLTLRQGRKQIAAPPSAMLSPDSAKGWFVAAGLLGSGGMWVSAASMIPVLAACAVGALVAVVAARIPDPDVVLRPELWRTWARWGCTGSLGFYLLEYFPSHLGWRLEVNHPLYALAWLSGGELLCRTCRKVSGGAFLNNGTGEWLALIASIAGALAPAVLIALRPDAVFWVADPFLHALHNDYIEEFRSMAAVLRRPAAAFHLLNFLLWPALALGTVTLLVMRGRGLGAWRPLLAFAFVAAALVQALAMAQVRWSFLAMGMWSVCVLLVVVVYANHRSIQIPRGVVATVAGLAVLAIVLFPQLSFRAWRNRGEIAQKLPKDIAPTILLRDIAHRLIQSSPHKLPVVLAGPNVSTELAYYGGIATLGTLYWDNLPGLKRAALIHASPTASEGLDLLRRAGVTHLVLCSWDDFSRPYRKLLQQTGERPPSQESSFIGNLPTAAGFPTWLRPLSYPIPASFGLEGAWVRIFEIVPPLSRGAAEE